MSGPVSLLGKPVPTIERNEGAKLVALLSVAGLIAGLISTGLVSVGGLYLQGSTETRQANGRRDSGMANDPPKNCG